MRLSNVLVLMVFISVLFACSMEPQKTLRLGTNIWAGYEPLYLARNKAYFSPKHIHLVEFSSSTQVIQAYRNKLIDAAALTLDEALLLLESSNDFSVVLVLDISNGADAIMARADIKTLADIRNKRVGVESNALGAYVITRALDIAGLNKSDIKIVELEVNKQEEAFINNKVDAVVTFEPLISKLLSRGANKIFDSQQLPGEIVDVLIVRNSFIKNNRKTVQELIDAWSKSLAYINKNPIAAAKILGLRMKLNAADTANTYKYLILPDMAKNKFLLKSKPTPPLLISANKMLQLLLDKQLIRPGLNAEDMFRNNELTYTANQ